MTRFISAIPSLFLAKPINNCFPSFLKSIPTIGFILTALQAFVKSYIPVTVLMSVNAISETPNPTACSTNSFNGIVP